MSVDPSYTLIGSPYGRIALVWGSDGSRARVLRVFLPWKGETLLRTKRAFPGAAERSCPDVDRLGRSIAGLLVGTDVRFDLDTTVLERCSVFQQQVLRAEHAVPRGQVTTYGSLAAVIGRPGAARAVGKALASNPFPLIVPCHRAVRSDGGLGGYQGGARMKRALLEMEGIGFGPDGRIVDSFLLA